MPLGAGPGFEVHALTVHGGLLYAGGKSSDVKSWNGTAWGTLGSISGVSWVRTLYAYDGDLLAGVDYSGTSRAYRWNGVSWRPMGSLDGAVRRFVEVSGNLLALGSFNTAGGTPAEGVARWNGIDWEPFNTGAGSEFKGEVFNCTFYEDDLVIGGLFYADYSNDLGYRLAVKQPTGWCPFPFEFPHSTSGSIQSLAAYGGRLFIGGTFMSYLNGMSVLGPAGWENVGFPQGLVSMVFAMQEFEGSLYVGGYFSQVDGKASSYIGRYTDSSITAATEDAVPSPLRVGAAFPNPFRGHTTLGFVVEHSGPARVEVFALNGRRVRVLDLDLDLDGLGAHEVSWNGRDDRGAPAPSGIYFLRVQAGRLNQARKVVLNR